MQTNAVRYTKSISWDFYVMIGIGTVFLAYIVLRAILLSFVHDESYTYLYHSTLPLKDILLNNGPCPANNHLLNTLLVKIISHIGLKDEFFLRLPNVVSFLLYLVGSIGILQKIEKPIVRICGLWLLLCNQFVIEFFSLARGYGLALGFMMISLYMLFKVIEYKNARRRFVHLAILSAAFAVLSSFTFLNFYIVFLGLVLLVDIYFRITARKMKVGALIKHSIVSNLVVFSITFILFAVIVIPLYKLRSQNQLYYGGATSFYSDTIISLLQTSLYKQSYLHKELQILGFGVIGIIILCTVFFYLRLRQCLKEHVLCPASLVFVLIVSCALGTIIQFELLDTKYLIERTALFFIPLFTIVFIFLVSGLSLTMYKRIRLLPVILFVAITMLCAVHFARTVNLSHTWTWDYDADTKQMMRDLIKRHEENPPDNEVTIAAHWTFQPSISFYYLKYDMTWLVLDQFGHEKDKRFDYYYYTPEQEETIAYPNREEITRYDDTGNILSKGI